MNSKGHYWVSMAKSFLRIAACVLVCTKQIDFCTGFAIFGVAEILGIIEERVDKR